MSFALVANKKRKRLGGGELLSDTAKTFLSPRLCPPDHTGVCCKRGFNLPRLRIEYDPERQSTRRWATARCPPDERIRQRACRDCRRARRRGAGSVRRF